MTLVYDETQLREPNLLVPGKKPGILAKPLPIVENWIRFPEAIWLTPGGKIDLSTGGTVNFLPEKISFTAGSCNWTQSSVAHGAQQTWVLITDYLGYSTTMTGGSADAWPNITLESTTQVKFVARGFSSTATLNRAVSVGEKLICICVMRGVGSGFIGYVYTPLGEYLGEAERTSTSGVPYTGSATVGIGHASGYIRTGAAYDIFSITGGASREQAQRIALDPYQFLEAV